MHLPHGGVVRIVMQHFVICIFIWVGFLLEIVALRVKNRQIFVNFQKQLKKGCKRRTLSVLKNHANNYCHTRSFWGRNVE